VSRRTGTRARSPGPGTGGAGRTQVRGHVRLHADGRRHPPRTGLGGGAVRAGHAAPFRADAHVRRNDSRAAVLRDRVGSSRGHQRHQPIAGLGRRCDRAPGDPQRSADAADRRPLGRAGDGAQLQPRAGGDGTRCGARRRLCGCVRSPGTQTPDDRDRARSRDRRGRAAFRLRGRRRGAARDAGRTVPSAGRDADRRLTRRCRLGPGSRSGRGGGVPDHRDAPLTRLIRLDGRGRPAIARPCRGAHHGPRIGGACRVGPVVCAHRLRPTGVRSAHRRVVARSPRADDGCRGRTASGRRNPVVCRAVRPRLAADGL